VQYSPVPAAAGPRGGVTLRTAVTITVLIVGWSVSVFALSNVPGAMTIDETTGEAAVSDGGLLLALLVTVAWPTLFWRRSRPLVPTIAGAVLALFGVDVVLLLLGGYAVMTGRPAARRPWVRWGVPVLVVVFAVREAVTPWGGALMLLSEEQTPTLASEVVMPLVLGACALGAYVGALALHRARGAAAAAADAAARERGRADDLGDELAHTRARERIARDLHDTLAHSLATISFQTGAIQSAVTSSDPRAAEYAQALRGEVVRASDQLASLVNDLRTPDIGDRLGPTPTLTGIVDLVRSHRAAGVVVDTDILVVGLDGASEALQQAVYRLVQEALTNAVKHAPGQPVRLFLAGTPAEGIRLRVENRLAPRPGDLGSHGSGAGTVGMRERVEQAGGTVWIGTHQGLFIVDAELPWPVVGAEASGVGGSP